MTIDNDQFTQFFKQGQDALRTTVETWTNTLKAVAGQVPTFAQPFDTAASLDRYFDLNEKVLEAQRDFAKKVLATGTTVKA